ncbi:hypothetical protein [Pseudarthrobacter sp. MDT3-1]
MLTHLAVTDKSRRRTFAACGVNAKPGSDFTGQRAYVTCNKCRGTKVFLEAESGIVPVHTSAIHYLEIALRANESSIREAEEENKEIDDPGEWERLHEEREQLVTSLATLKALQEVDLMATK